MRTVIWATLAVMLASSEVRAGRQWTCDATCNVQQIDKKASCPDRVSGAGTGPDQETACNAAQKNANNKVPRGCYKRHCDCDCKK